MTKKKSEEFCLESEVQEIVPMKANLNGQTLHIFLGLITGSVWVMVFIWLQKVWRSVRYTQVSVDLADYLLLVTDRGAEIVVDLSFETGEDGKDRPFVIYRYRKFILEDSGVWRAARWHISDRLNSDIVAMQNGVDINTLTFRQKSFGENSTKINIENPIFVFARDALQAMTYYQAFSVFVWWGFRSYGLYAILIMCLAIINMLYQTYIIISFQRKINRMNDNMDVTVFRMENGQQVKSVINSSKLVPGDIIEVQEGKLPCDLILLDGSTLMDEALLTGESVPMHKSPLSNNGETFNEHRKENILMMGTTVMTSYSSRSKKELARAIVFQTGFSSVKGGIIRNILYDEPKQYKFERDGNWFFFYLILLSFSLTAIYFIIAFVKFPDDVSVAIIWPAVDITLTMVPPGLLVCLSLGVEVAIVRLRLSKIVATRGRLVNASGRMKVCFFDKTGTLTVNVMALVDVLCVFKKENQNVLIDSDDFIQAGGSKDFEHVMYQNFVTNHTLALIKGEIVGDPMETELFKSGKGTLEESNSDTIARKTIGIADPSGSKKKLTIMKLYDFDHHLQRMSVVVRDELTNKTYVFTKGAPEKLETLCVAGSIPDKYAAQVETLAKRGLRILAFGFKQLSGEFEEARDRTFYESDLNFQCFATFSNPMKEATGPTIKKLKENDFIVGMITGDNINTAIAISKICQIVMPHEQVWNYTFQNDKLFKTNPETGETIDIETLHKPMNIGKGKKAYTIHKSRDDRNRVGAIDNVNFSRFTAHYKLDDPKTEVPVKDPLIIELARRVRVFARMNPDQKGIITRIMKQYYRQKEWYVGYCGDGANDCVALKEADIGCSLSKTEASISAPFVSMVEDISCMETISIMGKAALTTNFDNYRFFCLYSIIQTIGLIMLFGNQTEYSIAIYFTMDFFIALNLSNCIGCIKDIGRLTKQLPKISLMNLEFMLSLVVNIIIYLAFMLGGIYWVKRDSNFLTPSQLSEKADAEQTMAALSGGAVKSDTASFETTVVSLMAIQANFTIAMSFNIRGRFKLRFWTSVYFLISLIIYVLYNNILLFLVNINGGTINDPVRDILNFFRVKYL